MQIHKRTGVLQGASIQLNSRCHPQVMKQAEHKKKNVRGMKKTEEEKNKILVGRERNP